MIANRLLAEYGYNPDGSQMTIKQKLARNGKKRLVTKTDILIANKNFARKLFYKMQAQLDARA